MADPEVIEPTPPIKRRTARQNWRLLKAVWRAMRAFIGSPNSASLVKRAYHHWQINEHTTKLIKTLSIQGHIQRNREVILLNIYTFFFEFIYILICLTPPRYLFCLSLVYF